MYNNYIFIIVFCVGETEGTYTGSVNTLLWL